MAIYYTIEAKGFDKKKKLQSKKDVCLEIRANQLKQYKVFEKDDSHSELKSLDTAAIFPLIPMCNDITFDIRKTLSEYEKMEKETE